MEKKNKSEKIILGSIKALQMVSRKSLKKLLQFTLISTIPIFKANIIIQKKRKKKKQKSKIIPKFIGTRTSRISFAIKFIVTTAKKKTNQTFLQKLSEEILLHLSNKSGAIRVKEETQKQVFLNRNLFTRYRWQKA
mmetsp:Transcript_780/g.1485  ORF Transcript_780/g.1485 Transcript_780/m.1485 type:complete len:136 (-) Transcript_780:1031-1438(-)